MKKISLVLALLLLPAVSFAAIYKWTDKEGTVHYSDQPQPGAATIKLPAETTKDPVSSAESLIHPKTGIPPLPSIGSAIEKQLAAGPAIPPTKIEASKVHNYTDVTIASPQDQGTVTDNNGTVSVVVNLEPQLVLGDKLQAFVDGKAFGEPATAVSLSITGVNRGQHSLSVEVQDSQGTPLKTSNSITFHLRKASIKK